MTKTELSDMLKDEIALLDTEPIAVHLGKEFPNVIKMFIKEKMEITRKGKEFTAKCLKS